LLNVGPKPDGTVQDEFVARLKEVGAWLGTYGDSIYGTRGGPVGVRPWGVTTAKKDRVYVHVLDWPDRALVIPRFAKPVKSARVMGGAVVPVSSVDNGLLLQLPEAGRNEFDTVIEVVL
jgi:alpha-L-fucosidase